jgi:glycosyltransferase involved in cell wall biosynthesis
VLTSSVSEAGLTASSKHRPRISIAIATYNGERFLEEQMASIAHQSLLPTEVIVADDNSQDGTLEVVRRFAARAPFEVHIVQHARNIGVLENFYSVFDACRGD